MKKIKEFFIKSKPKLLIAVSLVLIFLAVLNIYFAVLVRVTSNDECLWVPMDPAADSTAIYFDLVKYGGVAWNAGIRNGDRLLKINENNLKTTAQAQRILNAVKSGDSAKYVIKKKDGKILETKVYVKKLIQFPVLALGILGLIWTGLGFIVLVAKQGAVQKTFYLTGAASVLSIVYLLIPQPADTGGFLIKILPPVLGMLWAVGSCFFPFMIMYFFWIFPKPFGFVRKKWFKKLFFGIPSILLISLAAFIFIFFTKLRNPNFVFNVISTWLNISLGVGFIVGWISLIINYRRLKAKSEKKPISVILVAYTLTLLAIFYTVQIAPAITDSIFNSPAFYTPIILIILLPISFAHSIFKYQLMDVSVVVKNTIIYGAATLTLAALYFLLIYVIGQSISQAIGTEYQTIIAGIFFISFALVFQSTKDKFQDFLTAKFYPEQFAYQKVLMKFSSEVASMVGLDNILDSTRDTLVDALMINRFGIMISEPDKKTFALVRSVGIENEKLVLRSTGLQKLLNEKYLAGKKNVIDCEEFNEIFPGSGELLIAENIYTIIPMVIKSEIIGLLLFGLKHSGAQFAGKDLELLSAAANQTAISIENARLYQLEAQKLKIERDLELAKRIQQGLLPGCIPNINGLDICGEMISAMQVGGDYFDLISVSDKKLFVVVGDVSGKGLSASLYMAKLQTMMQLYCVDNKSPKEILVQINKKLYQEMEKSWFVTLTLAQFDIEKKQVTFCRAGHVPVLVALNDKVDLYKTTGLGLGLEKGYIFEKTLIEEKIDLIPGQVYAFFSDGITEAMNENNEIFGEEKLSEILKEKTHTPSTQIMDNIWNAVKAFRGKAEQNDDMTAVLVRVRL